MCAVLLAWQPGQTLKDRFAEGPLATDPDASRPPPARPQLRELHRLAAEIKQRKPAA